MSDQDVPSRNDPAGTRPERYQLPVPVPQRREAAGNGTGWFARLLGAFLGWRAGSIRADLETVLETGTAGETGFSPEEQRDSRWHQL